MAANINTLSNEVLLHIFQYISTSDLVSNVSNVCSRWKDIVNDKNVWKNRKFVCNAESNVDEIVRIISENPNLQEVCVENRNGQDSVKILNTLFECCTALQVLNLSISDCELFPPSRLHTFRTDSVIHLKELNIHISYERCSMTGHLFIEGIRNMIRKFTNLRKLSIPLFCCMKGSDLRGIADSCKYLQQFKLEYCSDLCDKDLIYFLEKTKNTLLVFSLCSYSAVGLFLNAMSSCTKLQSLLVDDCSTISDENFCKIKELNLKFLSLGMVGASPSVMCEVFRNRNLAGLLAITILHSDSVNDCVVQSISMNCVLLQSVTLRFCQNVTSSGIREILSRCKSLKGMNLMEMKSVRGDFLCVSPILELKLYLTHVNDEFAQNLPINCPALQSLTIVKCNGITDSGVVDILVRCQHLRKIYLGRLRSVTGYFLKSISECSKSLEYLQVDKVHRCRATSEILNSQKPKINFCSINEEFLFLPTKL